MARYIISISGGGGVGDNILYTIMYSTEGIYTLIVTRFRTL